MLRYELQNGYESWGSLAIIEYSPSWTQISFVGDGVAATGKTVTVAFSVKVEVIWRLFARPAAGQQRAGVKNRKSIKAGACREKESCITHEIMTVVDLWRYTKD